MRVLARAYKDRPLDRLAVGENVRVIYVANATAADSTGIDRSEGVGFPKNCVFQFDSGLFESLSVAWDQQDRRELGRLWKRAKPISGSIVSAAPLEMAEPA